MKKNIYIFLIVCLSAITSWAGSTSDVIENLNRKLPLDANSDRLLSKIIYDEVNNIVVANYFTSWQNLVQMRKLPDFSKRAASEVLEYIFLEDSSVQPFTLVVNYFADEAGFEDLAKTYFISPGQVANVQKVVQKGNQGNTKSQQPIPNQSQQPVTAIESQVDPELQTLAARLEEFKGYAEPQGQFQIAKYALSQDKKDINIIVLASPQAMPFFLEEQFAPALEEAMCSRLSKQYPELENIFNTKDLNVVVYAADQNGNIKGRYSYPASHVFANKSKGAQDDGKAKGKDKEKDKGTEQSNKKKDKDKDKSKTKSKEESNQRATQPEQTPVPTQTLAPVQTDNPSTSTTGQPTPAPQVEPAQPMTQSQTQQAQTLSDKKEDPEFNFQSLLKLYEALLPQKLADGLSLVQLKANKEALMLLVEVDGEKYPETSVSQIRANLLKHLAVEFGKKKSVYPLMLSLCCQTSRQYIYVLSSKSWSSTYPVPMEPCSIIESLKAMLKK